jgi:Putative lumazine-binding
VGSVAPETTEIEQVVQLYIDGAREGDAAKLRAAFHSDARMFGSLGGQRVDMPIADFFAMADGSPADVDGSYEARIVAVNQVGDAATVQLDEDGYWGTVSFTDFFALSRIDGKWAIVNKTFAHTAGDPPPM